MALFVGDCDFLGFASTGALERLQALTKRTGRDGVFLSKVEVFDLQFCFDLTSFKKCTCHLQRVSYICVFKNMIDFLFCGQRIDCSHRYNIPFVIIVIS